MGAGYILLKKKFGFNFKFNSYPDSYLHTIAHELGHGPFRLRHTFSPENPYQQDKGQTTNLLDYAGANADGLYKYQWDLIHDPQSMLFAFLQNEEEGMKKQKENYRIYWNGNTNLKDDLSQTITYGDVEDEIKLLTNAIDKSVFLLAGYNDFQGAYLPMHYDILLPGRDDQGKFITLYDYFKEKYNGDEFDVFIFFSRTNAQIISNNRELEDYINSWLAQDEIYYSFTRSIPSYDRNSNFCLIKEIFAKIATYYNSTDYLANLTERRCFKIYSPEQQPIDESNVATPEISEIRTSIDLKGNITINWKTTGTIRSYIQVKGSNGYSIIDNVIQDGDYYSVTIEANRKDETNYLIIADNIRKYLTTGNFQGDDNSSLCAVYGPIGKVGDNSKYTYSWTDENGNIPEEFKGNATKSYFNFIYKEKKVYKLTRSHKNDDIVDEALVMINPQDDCGFTFEIEDNTIHNNLARKPSTSDEVLEVVWDNNDEFKLLLKTENDKPYGIGYPKYYVDENLTDKGKTELTINMDRAGEYEIVAEAYNLREKYKVRVYDVDSKELISLDINDPKLNSFIKASNVCAKFEDLQLLLDDINKHLSVINNLLPDEYKMPELDLPITCTQNKDLFKEYNAEIYGKCSVVREIEGELNYGISVKNFSLPAPIPGLSVSLGLSIDPIVIEYDSQNRKELGSKISLYGGTGRGNLMIDYSSLISVESTLMITIQESKLHGCEYEIIFGYSEVIFNYLNPGDLLPPIPPAPGKTFAPRCIISE